MAEKLGRSFLGITSMAFDLQHISHLDYVEHFYVSIFQGVAFFRNTMVTLGQIFFFFIFRFSGKPTRAVKNNIDFCSQKLPGTRIASQSVLA